MKTRRGTFARHNCIDFFIISFLLVALALPCMAISSKITRQKSGPDFLAGEAKDVVVDSRGTIELGRAAEMLVEKFEDVWAVNAIVVSGGTVYIGTSPNGGIYEYSLGKLKKIYSAEREETKKESEPEGSKEVEDVNAVKEDEHLANEHIFAMATDISGRLLAGISGDSCRLVRLKGGEMITIFEPNDAKYIFAIKVDDSGNIYLGTGPEGKVYRLNSSGKNAEVVYDSSDKNILSLAIGDEGFVYAGSDSRGLIYKIDPDKGKATVLYDSDRDEITGLLYLRGKEYLDIFGASESDEASGVLYAAGTSAKVVTVQKKFAAQIPLAGRPDVKAGRGKSSGSGKSGLTLTIANTMKGGKGPGSKPSGMPGKGSAPEKASYIYKISKDGYVTNIFGKNLVFFSLGLHERELLVGTGNGAELYSIDPVAEEEKVIYLDEQASQISVVVVSGKNIYLGTSNPAKLVKLGKDFAYKGNYTSSLIDAGQPAKWGKLQIEADIPEGCKILVSSRSGNVADVNDPTFSTWSEPMEITRPVQLRCPVGRFSQYKLMFESDNGKESPLVKEVAVASTVPNLAPRVKEISVNRSEGKTGMFKIGYKAEDDNADKLIYKIDFRKAGRENWIELKDELEESSFEWDGRMVEDGRYEVMVTASDERSNSPGTQMKGSRISEQVVVDNTGPVINKSSIIKSDNGKVILKLHVIDKLSIIGKVNYTIDSNTKWRSTIPDDLVYDTMNERFTIETEELEPGEHIISVRVSDDVGNVTYKTYEFNVSGE
ncbi:MAG: hypothetical protein FVQ80_01455 [Planctomycetes bacterium]|nr:hypothetical protein [Planctomycetota bacterium]